MKYQHLTHAERYYIWQRLLSLDSITKIAKDLGVNKSTVSREIKRNNTNGCLYHPLTAQLAAKSRRKLFKAKYTKLTDKTKAYIINKLKQTWSPERISGRMPNNIKVSHETIYQFIRNDRKCKGKLYKLLPYRGKKYNYHGNKRSIIANRTDIALRPKSVENKTRIGDYEVDNIIGKYHGSKQCLLTFNVQVRWGI